MSKLNAKLERKIKEREEDWEKQTEWSRKFFKYVKRDVKNEFESMMYGKKPRDKTLLIWGELKWFVKVGILFLAFSRITQLFT